MCLGRATTYHCVDCVLHKLVSLFISQGPNHRLLLYMNTIWLTEVQICIIKGKSSHCVCVRIRHINSLLTSSKFGSKFSVDDSVFSVSHRRFYFCLTFSENFLFIFKILPVTSLASQIPRWILDIRPEVMDLKSRSSEELCKKTKTKKLKSLWEANQIIIGN